MLSNKSSQIQDTTNDKVPELLTLQEACEVLKVHPNTLRKWDKKGILTAVRFGERKDRRYRKEDIMRLLDGIDKL